MGGGYGWSSSLCFLCWAILLNSVSGESYLNGTVAVRIFNSTFPEQGREVYTSEATKVLTQMGFQIVSEDAIPPSESYGAPTSHYTDHYAAMYSCCKTDFTLSCGIACNSFSWFLFSCPFFCSAAEFEKFQILAQFWNVLPLRWEDQQEESPSGMHLMTSGFPYRLLLTWLVFLPAVFYLLVC